MSQRLFDENFPKIEQTEDLDISRVELVVAAYSDKEKKDLFFSEIVKSDPDFAKVMEKEPRNPVFNAQDDAQSWFQTSKAIYYIVSIGSPHRRDMLSVRRSAEKWTRAAISRKAENIAIWLFQASKAEQAVLAEAAVVANYSCSSLKSTNHGPLSLKKITIVGPQIDLHRVEAVGHSICIARELGNLPSGHATPKKIVQKVQEWNKSLGSVLEISVMGRSECEKNAMGAFLGVAQGSYNEPQMLVMQYNPPKKQKSKTMLGIVGKGVTFDTGGYNLKTGMPFLDLLSMKGDMMGAAATIGALLAIASIKPQYPVIGVCALTENMVSGTAIKPGDVLVHQSGKTIEVQNTDAEGRLVLSDALSLAQKRGATHLVDIATLTGACAIALGQNYTGLMTNDDDFGKTVHDICNQSGEPTWRLPLDFRQVDQLKSDVADLSNMGGGRHGGTMVAGSFLSQFVDEGVPWVHLDIAATADSKDLHGIHGTANHTGVMVSSMINLAGSIE